MRDAIKAPIATKPGEVSAFPPFFPEIMRKEPRSWRKRIGVSAFEHRSLTPTRRYVSVRLHLPLSTSSVEGMLAE
jgi:hypothetical protein